MNESQMMHGVDWRGEYLVGFILSEKFNGCRAYWDGNRLWSRGGMSPQLPDGWTLPNIPLDCELYDGVDGLYRCGAALRYSRFTSTMRLMVFDAPMAAGDYQDRMAVAKDAVACSAIAECPALTVCQSNSHALSLLLDIQSRGGEGIVARVPGLKYRSGRTREMMKVKRALR